MADKTVGELPRASTVTTTDLFVMEQAGQAKSLTGQVLINDLATALDGHGGIKSITLNDDYTLTFIMADDTEVKTTSVRGATGAKGDKGTDGRAITSVAKISTSGLVDTYKISFSDNTSTNFTVTNGSSIKSIAKTGTSGLTDTYTVTLTDGTTSTFAVKNGNGIASITLQSGTHAAGTTDTYKITFDNGEHTTFSVYNGMNGSGSVVTVNGTAPDTAGNVVLTGSVIPVSSTDSTLIPSAIEKRQIATNDLTAEATLADGDYFPFYDVSATENRKTPWSNIVSKITSLVRSAFLQTPLSVDSGGTGATDAATARANLGALSSAAGAVGASNLAADAVKLTFTNVVVQASQWGSPTAYEDFPYYAQIALEGVTAAMIPEVVFSTTDAISGIFAPTAFSYDGFIHILASEQPSAAVTIPTIILWR